MFEILLGVAALALYANSKTARDTFDRSMSKNYNEGRVSDKDYENYKKQSDKIKSRISNNNYDD